MTDNAPTVTDQQRLIWRLQDQMKFCMGKSQGLAAGLRTAHEWSADPLRASRVSRKKVKRAMRDLDFYQAEAQRIGAEIDKLKQEGAAQ
jgi:hypothetical protein